MLTRGFAGPACVEGMCVREASRVFGLQPGYGACKIFRALFWYSPGYRSAQDPPRRPKLEPFTGVIDAILEATDRQVPQEAAVHHRRELYL